MSNTCQLELNVKTLTLNIIRPLYSIITWNVDGYSDIIHNWLKQLINNNKPDIIFLNETKTDADKLNLLFSEFTDYNFIINVHIPFRYHGVAFLIRKDHTYTPFDVDMNIPSRQDTTNGDPSNGRLIAFEFNNDFIVVGTYVPNSGTRGTDNHIIPKFDYRVKIWDPALQLLLNTFQTMKPTIWLGDINVASSELDVSNAKTMNKMAGFTPEERVSFNSFIKEGNWIDIWRHQHPGISEYTWVSYNPRPNYGMRLDNIIVSSHLLNRIHNTFTLPNCGTSTDHLPIGACIIK